MTPSTARHRVQRAVVDASSPAARHDPYPAYDVLRAAGPFVPADPDLALAAVDEILRHDPSVHLTTRTARAELSVGGQAFAPVTPS